MWIKVDGEGRVVAACMVKAPVGDDAVQVVKPAAWDWGKCSEWVLEGGTLVHAPMQDTKAPITTDARLAALEEAVLGLMMGGETSV